MSVSPRAVGAVLVKAIAPHDRPREKLARAGGLALGDNELVALILGTGTRSRDALRVAQDVMTVCGGVHGIARVALDELTRVPGVGAARAARLLAAIEFGRRVIAAHGGDRPRFETPAAVGRYLLSRYGAYRVERFGVVLLDAKHRLIKESIVSVGTVDSSIAHPRDIYREATIASAAKIVVFHNHPSGDPHPSADDVVLTRRLKEAGDVMGIEMADHIILGDGKWFSFRDASCL